MTEVDGDGWAELQPDGSLQGQFCIHNGDEIDFIALRGRLFQQPARDAFAISRIVRSG